MMHSPEPYLTARGVEAAIKEAAKKAAQADPSIDTSKRIQLEYFNRFLSRIFSEGEDSEWVLKGGAGVLARIPSTRSTRDIDLYRQGFSLDQALEDLRRLASADLGDHFRFEYTSHEASTAADAQPYTDGYRVSFNIFIGVAGRGSVQIDLVVGAGMTDEVEIARPASTLDLPRLTSNRYRLYPVVDQVADKVCATMADYDGRPSSREKDLVDIVVFAVTQDIDGTALSLAIDTELHRRKMAATLANGGSGVLWFGAAGASKCAPRPLPPLPTLMATKSPARCRTSRRGPAMFAPRTCRVEPRMQQ